MTTPLLQTNLSGVKVLSRGKVRDIYDLGDALLIVATDRISAFDHILPSGIPDKGKVLNQISLFWFDRMKGVVRNHLRESDADRFPEALRPHAATLRGRAVVVERLEMLPIECVVRGYLSGSGYREYLKTGAVCGIRLPAGLRESDRLPEPIFTPSTKAATGHDENIPFARMAELVGAPAAEALRERSLAIYEEARAWAWARGLVLADTKFEFGRVDGRLTLIDEALTPDSSRYWDREGYEAGRLQSFDKQYVRDWLDRSGWDHEPPAPPLPADVVASTQACYLEAIRRLSGGPR
jgi:phosphoribosylaminoimidazole-succinocarboxamide synthase